MFVDAYNDLEANLAGSTGFSTKDTLAFCLFCTVQCNGSLAIADIVRNLAFDDWKEGKKYNSKFGRSLWNLLLCTSVDTKFTSVGSCTQPRYQITIGRSIFNFDDSHEIILQQFSNLTKYDKPDVLYQKFTELLDYLKKHVKHIGHVTGLKFIQLSSLLGLLPLRVATFGTVDSGGPARLLASVDSSVSPKFLFRSLLSDLQEVYGKRCSGSYLENLLCELKREMAQYSRKHGKRDSSPLDLYSRDRNNATSNRCASPQKDHLVLYQHRGFEQLLNNLYSLHIDNSGKVSLQMQIFKLDMNLTKIVKLKQVKADANNRICISSYYHGYAVKD